MNLDKGMLVQIDPESKLKSFRACIMIVKEYDAEEGSISGCIISAKKGHSEISWVKVPESEVEPIQERALWLPEDMVDEDEVEEQQNFNAQLARRLY